MIGSSTIPTATNNLLPSFHFSLRLPQYIMAQPWIWQQWAMLKLEEKLRFQEGHQHDCMEMDVQKYGAGMYTISISQRRS